MVILTGAGISAESGLATFRGLLGLWMGFKVEEVCHPEAFENNPELVWEFYNNRREEILSSEVFPNKAHDTLAKLEGIKNLSSFIITQNVDNLHERAGSSNILHIHGQLLKNKCHDCKETFPGSASLTDKDICPFCGNIGRLRPDVVFFTEQPYFLNQCISLVSNADVFISIGTSGQVYPAANFVVYAKQNKALTIEINPTKNTNGHFDIQVPLKATEGVPLIVDALIELLS